MPSLVGLRYGYEFREHLQFQAHVTSEYEQEQEQEQSKEPSMIPTPNLT